MKFLHISDLHLGKRLHEVSLLNDQKFILDEIHTLAKREHIDALIIAGDIYDKSIPPVSAIELFDAFLFHLSQDKIKVFLISGNHDSPERTAYGGRLMEKNGIYISPVFHKENAPICLSDEYGEVFIYLLPFIKPAHVREVFPDKEINDYSDAISVAIERMNVNTTKRNLLVTHQFVTGATRCDSEDISVGGSDNVNAEVMNDFDYVALGHIHRAQTAGSDRIRYCGTPLKYSFSEANHTKSVTIVTLNEKEKDVGIQEIPLNALHEMHIIKGPLEHIMDTSIYNTYPKDSYVQIILTDEEEALDVISKLRQVFANVLCVEYDNIRTRENQTIEEVTNVEEISPLDLFKLLYEKQNNSTLKDEQETYLTNVIEEIWGGIS